MGLQSLIIYLKIPLIQVLKFVTECLSKNEFEVLEEKLSPEALEKARAIALAQSSKSEDLVFEGVSTFFQSESRVFFPWVYTANNKSKRISGLITIYFYSFNFF